MNLKLNKGNTDFRYVLPTVVFAAICSVAYMQVFLGEYYGNFPSDLGSHISAGSDIRTSYSLMYILLALLDKLPHAGTCIAVFLTLWIWFSVYTHKLLISFLAKTLSNEAAWFWAWICHMVYPLLFLSTPLRGVYNSNLIHNSTQLGMKPCMLLAILSFCKVVYEYKDRGISRKSWLSIAGALLAATVFKPNFTVGFAMVALCFLAFDFARAPKKSFWNCIALGTTVLPSVLVFLYQQSLSLNHDSQLKVGWFKAFEATNNYPITGVLVSIAFPLACLAFAFKELPKDRPYCLAWVNFLANFLIAALLYETGAKISHGNFLWGLSASVGVLFAVSICKYLKMIKQGQMVRIVVLSMFLGMHEFAWFKYMYEIVHGGNPW